jgi:hypothetical protein
MNVERPPELWAADTEETPFLALLGEMIAAGLSKGAILAELILNVSNVVVEPSADDEDGSRPPLPGEYVAVTVSGGVDFGPDALWPGPGASASELLRHLEGRFAAAQVRCAYIRRLPETGSLTVFLSRRTAEPL